MFTEVEIIYGKRRLSDLHRVLIGGIIPHKIPKVIGYKTILKNHPKYKNNQDKLDIDLKGVI